jgi:nucleoside-diphosphate-sugar epimerase
MKVLVTGAAGYIGSLLVPALLEDGHEVIAFDNLMYGGLSLLPNFIHPRFRFVKGDVRDESALSSAVRAADAVVHLAAIVGFPACRKYPELARDVNIEGTRRVVAAKGKGQLLVFASTGSNYGRIEGVCTEESPLNPVSLYGLTKTEAEKICLDAAGGAAVLRFATAFGLSPRPRQDLLVNDFVYQAMINKQIIVYERYFRRSFIHVRDITRGLRFALGRYSEMVAQSFNIGHESMNFTKEEIALKIREKIPFYLHFAEIGRDEDQRDYEVSYRKIRALGFEPGISLDQGVEELIAACAVIDSSHRFSNI